MESMRILVTLDEAYLPPLQVLLTSLHVNHPGETMEICLLHAGIPAGQLLPVKRQCERFRFVLREVEVDGAVFAGAPVTRQYPQAMYYRLLAGQLLPTEMERALYLDPDTLVINSLRPLWELDLNGRLFAAAAHSAYAELVNNLNQVRLKTGQEYFNSGVLLMDLTLARREIRPEDVFRYAAEHGKELLLPDQDILNALYGRRILPLDDAVWNYDARGYRNYLLRSAGQRDLDWVMAHTAVLHFCGKAKPWRRGYMHRFGVLYKHYIELTRRTGLYLG